MEQNSGIDKVLQEIRQMKELVEPYKAVFAARAAMEKSSSAFGLLDAVAKIGAAVEKSTPLSSLAWMHNFKRHQGMISAIADMNAHIERIKPLDTVAWLEKVNPIWANPLIGNWSNNIFKDNFLDQFKTPLWHHEIYNGIALSSAVHSSLHLSQSFNRTLREGAEFDLYPDALRKQSRIISSYLEEQRSLLQIRYDLSAVQYEAEPEPLVGTGNSIGQITIVKEAKRIKKVIQEIYCNNDRLFTIDPRLFEELVAELFSKKGFEVELTKQTRDGGYDIIALKNVDGIPLKFLVECKRYARKNPVGVEIIRSFFDVMSMENANKGVIFTSSYFTRDARERRNKSGLLLDLNDHDDLVNWVKDYIVGV